MIVTVTMNPAVDRTVSIESLHRGGLNRIRKQSLMQEKRNQCFQDAESSWRRQHCHRIFSGHCRKKD